MCYELRCQLKLVYLHKSKFLSYYTVRYHRALRTAVSFRCSWPPTTSRGFLSHSPMIVFRIVFLMHGSNGRASSKVMCGPHASFYSSVASHPTLPRRPIDYYP